MHPIALRDADLSRKVCALWESDDVDLVDVGHWSLRDCEVLMHLRHGLTAPSQWYLAWYRHRVLSGVAEESSESDARNPRTVYHVCAFEWSRRLELMGLSSAETGGDGTYLDKGLVDLILARKGLSHSERNRAQALHMALTITRPMWLSSMELGIAGSSSQMQRKWLPDAWLEHLVSDVFKYFVSQLLILERWTPGFISSSLVFARDIHLRRTVDAVCSLCGGEDPRALCVISHEEAVILRGLHGELVITWRGPIDLCVSAWIEFGSDLSLRERSRSLRSKA